MMRRGMLAPLGWPIVMGDLIWEGVKTVGMPGPAILHLEFPSGRLTKLCLRIRCFGGC